MMDPVLNDLLPFPGWIGVWVLLAVSMALFIPRVAFFLRVFRAAKPENRFTHIGKRLMHVVVDVLFQPRFRDRTNIIHGFMWPVHFLIFWGFVVFAGSFGLLLLKGLVPALPYPWPDRVGPIGLLLDVFGVVVLVALLVAAVRRYIIRPPRVKATVDAATILVLIALVMLTSLAGSAADLVASGETGNAWRPVSTILAAWFAGAGLGSEGARVLYLVMWWSHVAIVLGFLAYLPYSKHFHLLASPFGVFFTDLEPRGRMRGELEEESETAPFDARRFTWRELLTPLACAECGRCDRACPAFNSGEPLSPQDLIHGVKEHVLEIGATLGKKNGTAPVRALFEGIITPAEIWACTTCYSCMEHCPVRNEHLPLIFRMRRYAVSEGNMDARLQETLTAFMRYGNSYGQSERDRAKWTRGLPFKIPDARKQPVKYLWFVGDTASYDARLGDAVRAAATLFHAAGLDFGILYEAERNAGNDVRRIGEEGLFELLAQKNMAALKKCTFEEIITTDPHTYNTLKNEYPALGASWPVRHYTEILLDLIASGALSVTPLDGKRVTYHDPCYLGRYNGLYEAPRRILRAVGARLVEMPRHGRDGYCCGAGGGRIWMEDSPSVKERPSESRVREAAALRGVDTVVTACPKDIVMFLDAVKTTGLEGTLFIRDIAELVLQAVKIPANTAQET